MLGRCSGNGADKSQEKPTKNPLEIIETTRKLLIPTVNLPWNYWIAQAITKKPPALPRALLGVFFYWFQPTFVATVGHRPCWVTIQHQGILVIFVGFFANESLSHCCKRMLYDNFCHMICWVHVFGLGFYFGLWLCFWAQFCDVWLSFRCIIWEDRQTCAHRAPLC